MSVKTEIKDNWYRIKGLIRKKWEEITDDEIEAIDGRKEKLISSLMKKFSMTEIDAKHEVKKFWH